jgi:cytochrome c oxidase subunit 2
MGAVLVSLAVAAAPAGANVISPESPHSPNADDINTLYWIGLVVMVALIVVVNAALLGSVFRFRARRGHQPRQLRGLRRLQTLVAAGLAAFAVAMFVVSIVFTEKARNRAPTGPDGLQAASATVTGSGAAPIGTSTPPASKGANPLQITATGQEWLWRYTYPNGAFSYYQLVVPVDTSVQLDLVSTDVVHGWFVPGLGGNFDAVPGKTNHAWFRADQIGTYGGRSSTFSGPAYAADRIEVSVVTPDQYQSFIDTQKREIQDAQDIVVQQIQSGQTP